MNKKEIKILKQIVRVLKRHHSERRKIFFKKHRIQSVFDCGIDSDENVSNIIRRNSSKKKPLYTYYHQENYIFSPNSLSDQDIDIASNLQIVYDLWSTRSYNDLFIEEVKREGFSSCFTEYDLEIVRENGIDISPLEKFDLVRQILEV